jgi:transmembrane sensor
MSDKLLYISELIQKKLQGQISATQEAELENWLSEHPDKRLLIKQLQDESWISQGLEKFKSYDLVRSRKALESSLGEKTNLHIPQIPQLHFWKKSWVRIAASIMILLGTTTYFVYRHRPGIAGVIAIQHVKNDVAPGGNKAILTLSNGSKIVLDSAQNGNLAIQGNAKILKIESGKLSYTALNIVIPAEVVLNTLTTPRGGQYELTLPDGTRVWLNAASSITYPSAFADKERKVFITGEVYFEVAHNAAKPFNVRAGNEEVTVLGTNFNISSYSDEGAVKTTLFEGSVKLNAIQCKQSVIIKPGQQAQMTGSGITVMNGINTDEIIAWKEGLFHFESADLKTILRQFSRWYDIDVEYRSEVPEDKYFVIIKRSSNLSTVLKALQATGIQFKIENKKLIVG